MQTQVRLLIQESHLAGWTPTEFSKYKASARWGSGAMNASGNCRYHRARKRN
jgi:hypothetical protein